MKRTNFHLMLMTIVLSCLPLLLAAQQTGWPAVRTEMRPGSRWWWMGSAVDSLNLSYNIEQYAKAGMGTMEITPIYGVQGNEKNDIPFLSERWMDMYRYIVEQAGAKGMDIDMNNGTGWPFGGPFVSVEDAACKLLVEEYDATGGTTFVQDIEPKDEKQRPYARLERLMAFNDKDKKMNLTSKVINGNITWKVPKGDWHLVAAFCGKTLQKVKRAAPGGEGYVLDHFSKSAVKNYLNGFETAFSKYAAPYPKSFFNDSYEVYKADWTSGFFDCFERLRGYKLEDFLLEFLSEKRTDMKARLVSDYRETLSDMLLENFTTQWNRWAGSHGVVTRSQAHGSPGNLIDLYATVDIPECEGFGLSDFKIKGLRRDSLTRPNYSDISMLKYASSAAHITGKPYTSSETFTWLTEHFRTSLSQCKPDLDLMFLSGVNHVYFHGTTYSPKDAPWPGWKFYASVDMSPTNSFWRDFPAFTDYITKCQSFLQYGRPDNDFLLYLPLYDIWYEQDGRLLLFDIHKMDKRAPKFIDAVTRIKKAGYDVDYISDRFIGEITCKDSLLFTPGGIGYKALVIPGARLMTVETLRKLATLADEGATIVFMDRFPEDVPGWYMAEERKNELQSMLAELMDNRHPNVIFGTDYETTLARTGVLAEEMGKEFGLGCIRRVNDDGFHYFISALTDKDIDGWIPLSVRATSVVLYNPMNGAFGKIPVRYKDGRTEVYLQLMSGESVILKTFTSADVDVEPYTYYNKAEEGTLVFDGEWDFRFVEETPKVTDTSNKVRLGSWTELPGKGVRNTMGTARYSVCFLLQSDADEWLLSLGDVRESAKVFVNGKFVDTLWALPYQCHIGQYLHPGDNLLEVEVTNLPANRIADMDRRGILWRKFKDINMATINYKGGDYSHWTPMESGLLGPVSLMPMKRKVF